MTRKPAGPMAEKTKAWLKKHEQGINMGEAGIHVGRFAKSFAQIKQNARNAKTAASVAPAKPKTYDDIETKLTHGAHAYTERERERERGWTR